MSLDLTPLDNAIDQLAEALDLCDSDIARNDPKLMKHLRAATIQAFEFTYEVSLKMLRRYMTLNADSPAEIDHMTFSNFIRNVYGKNLVRSDLVTWRRYRKSRGTTSHTYNEDKAQKIFEGIPDFLDEARYVLNQLQERDRLLD